MSPWLAETMQLVARESGPDQPGKQAIADHLAQIIFIQAVRHCTTALPGDGGGWLAAAMDPEIGPALGSIHGQPEWPWTVSSLAKKTGMSRSVFAARFKALLSKPPQRYLLECRMRKACALLADGQEEIKQIASRVGYATVAAFSNAFKRWSGTAPGAYRRTLSGRSHGNGSPPG